ncbi:TonB-dependent receptor plug domain-containing protein [Beijerinckia indica]|uniref:TonB-dependent receptor plug n=1 Tax=Beijerinckia indica subsp. indica (strain ATCC 9039 / DSM 1715 / NCIMB 8712) TaxID=395963 RepID=B2IFV5_BEII9|nr:TonB-dependent receptor plug domain-containing protein [Beijerinckia indica]ACB95694.1 TonB-dependent receptor plug [Beijerinckia indica subsp. indica ATCC 9039]
MSGTFRRGARQSFQFFRFSTFAFIGLPVSAFAQNAPVTNIAPITIEASPDNSPFGRADLKPDNTGNLARVAASSRPHTETFTRADIDALKPVDVYDLLSHATGVMPTFQGRKLSNNLQIRGDSNYGFIIDGAYMPLATAGRVLRTLPVSLIEQVDIIRDPTALTLGPMTNLDTASGALNSGFIVIRTRRPSKTEGESRSRIENFGTFSSSGYAGTTFVGAPGEPNAYVSGLLSYRKTNGPSGYNAWENTQSSQVAGGVIAGGFRTDFTVFQDHARYGFQRATDGQNVSSLVAQQWSFTPIDTLVATSNSLFTWDAINSTMLILSYNLVSANNVQASYANSAITSNYDRTYTFNVHMRHNIHLGDTLLQLGTQYVTYDSPTGQMFSAGYAHSESILSGYGNLEHKFFNDALTLDASARVDDRTINQGIDLYNLGSGSGGGNAGSGTGSNSGTSQAGSGTGGGKSGSGSGSGTGSGTGSSSTLYSYFYNRQLPIALNYAAGGTWKILPQLLATARYSHTEQSGLPMAILTTTGTSLAPETQNKWEVGIAAPIAPYFQPGFNYFDINVANDKTPTSYQTINGYQTPIWSQSNTHRSGFELLANGTVLPVDWLGHGNPDLVNTDLGDLGPTTYRASWMHLGQASSSSIAVYGATLARDIVNFTLTQNWNRFNGTVALSYFSPFLSNFNSADGGYHQIGNAVVVDLSVGYGFKLGLSDTRISVYGRNITNRKYETVYGYPAWGATYGSELVISF